MHSGDAHVGNYSNPVCPGRVSKGQQSLIKLVLWLRAIMSQSLSQLHCSFSGLNHAISQTTGYVQKQLVVMNAGHKTGSWGESCRTLIWGSSGSDRLKIWKCSNRWSKFAQSCCTKPYQTKAESGRHHTSHHQFIMARKRSGFCLTPKFSSSSHLHTGNAQSMSLLSWIASSKLLGFHVRIFGPWPTSIFLNAWCWELDTKLRRECTGAN